MNNRIYLFSRAILVILCLIFSFGTSYADEGTEDVDFDYLPPDEPSMFGRFTDFIADAFRTPSHAGSYTTAKKRLYKKILDSDTLYCGCDTNLDERTFDKLSCGYTPRNDNERAHRIEAEHVLPAFWIANFHAGESCWVADDVCGSARECCLENDERFKVAHNDLVNLMPSVGELNADRSNYIYDLIDNEMRDYGNCNFEIDRSTKTMEPKESIRGDVARVYFYMRDSYDLVYPDDLTSRLEKWHLADPISQAEKNRNQLVQDTQGSSNPLVAD